MLKPLLCAGDSHQSRPAMVLPGEEASSDAIASGYPAIQKTAGVLIRAGVIRRVSKILSMLVLMLNRGTP